MKRMTMSTLFFLSFVAACSNKGTFVSDRTKSKNEGADKPIAATTPTPTPTAVINPTPVPVNPVVPQSECYKADPFICEVEKAIWRQTNEYRKQQGRSELALGMKMSFVSRDWSEKQAARGYIGHSGFPSSRYTVFNTEFPGEAKISMSSENVAYSGSSSTDPEAVAKIFTRMWINSSGHRANILGNRSTIGVGVYKKGSRTYYATQIFGKE